MFETLRTAFKVMIANMTQNKLLIIGFVVVALMIVWSVVTLLIDNQVKFRKNCFALIKYCKENEITSENYPKFVRLWANLPESMKFAWKRYEVAKTGKPSNYLTQNECVDLYVSGGVQKQNRSLMRSVIGITTAFLVLFSLSIIGTASASGQSTTILTTTLVVDALLVPLVIYILLMVNYYVYTAIRHQQYKTMVDVFRDLVDCLDDKIDIDAIFGKETKAIGLISSVYENETIKFLVEDGKKDRNKKMDSREVKTGGTGLNPLKTGILGVEDAEDKTGDNVIITDNVGSNKLADETLNTEFKITNERMFVETVNRVEELLKVLDKEKDEKKRTEIEKEVNADIKALTEYKQKAKAKKNKAV